MISLCLFARQVSGHFGGSLCGRHPDILATELSRSSDKTSEGKILECKHSAHDNKSTDRANLLVLSQVWLRHLSRLSATPLNHLFSHDSPSAPLFLGMWVFYIYFCFVIFQKVALGALSRRARPCQSCQQSHPGCPWHHLPQRLPGVIAPTTCLGQPAKALMCPLSSVILSLVFLLAEPSRLGHLKTVSYFLPVLFPFIQQMKARTAFLSVSRRTHGPLLPDGLHDQKG